MNERFQKLAVYPNTWSTATLGPSKLFLQHFSISNYIKKN